MAQPDYRHTTTNIDVCVLDDGKMLLLDDARSIDLKFIAAPLTGNQLKEGRKKSAGKFRSAVGGLSMVARAFQRRSR